MVLNKNKKNLFFTVDNMMYFWGNMAYIVILVLQQKQRACLKLKIKSHYLC